ncbi:MAG TPA: hypothetical protein VLC52_08165, partial [Anaerolineae bacterium]|nr:hypothetical protein [Anaerolineae bacterium]
EPVPTSVLTGSYNVVLSATAVLAPGDARWASDLIWVGGWQPPPPALAPGHRIYLPLVLRR